MNVEASRSFAVSTATLTKEAWDSSSLTSHHLYQPAWSSDCDSKSEMLFVKTISENLDQTDTTDDL